MSTYSQSVRHNEHHLIFHGILEVVLQARKDLVEENVDVLFDDLGLSVVEILSTSKDLDVVQACLLVSGIVEILLRILWIVHACGPLSDDAVEDRGKTWLDVLQSTLNALVILQSAVVELLIGKLREAWMHPLLGGQMNVRKALSNESAEEGSVQPSVERVEVELGLRTSINWIELPGTSLVPGTRSHHWGTTYRSSPKKT